MNRKHVLFLLFTLALGACATTAGYEAILNTWKGVTEEKLVAKWGPPRSVYKQSNGGRILTYNRSRSVYVPGTTTTTPQSNFVTTVVGGQMVSGYVTTDVTTTTPGYTTNLSCTTHFYVNASGIIYSWRWRGNSCRARAPSKTKTISKTSKVIKKAGGAKKLPGGGLGKDGSEPQKEVQ